nr:hypothetical protein [Hyphomonadaceae bacterium]
AASMNLAIEVARFAAPVVLVAALVKLLADGIGQWLQRLAHLYWGARPRDVVVGFDPVARAVGRRLLAQGRAVTWLATVDGGDEARDSARRDAERDGGLLLIGDPSAPDMIAKAAVDRARRVFIRLQSDLASLDAAEAIRVWLADRDGPSSVTPETPRLRVFVDSPELSGNLSHAAAHGFVSGRDLAAFNLRAEGARRLVLRARFDRTALLLGQERVHVVIAGCGWQGEALLEEVLTLCLRAQLKPPLVTVIDPDAIAIRQRIGQRSPALLTPDLGINGWLAPRFVTCNLETLDYARADSSGWAPAGQQPVPVTAWVFCAQDDELNLRSALTCQSAMQTRRIDGAPVFARIWGGHQLGTDTLTQVNAFGTMEDALDQTRALDVDPDHVPRQLHSAYLKTEVVTDSIPQAYRTFATVEAASGAAVRHWSSLMESKKTSNRRAFHHAAMKLADLGFDWGSGEAIRLPVFSAAQRACFDLAEKGLAQNGFQHARTHDEAVFLAAMANEHDRWTLDRAVEGWQLSDVRDESRLLHSDMKPFAGLSAVTRAFDGVLLRALLSEHASTQSQPPPAFAHAAVCVVLEHGQHVRASAHPDQWAAATEIIVTLPTGHLVRPERTVLDLDAGVAKLVRASLGTAISTSGCFCRLVLVFRAPPTPPVMALANALAVLAWQKGHDVHPIWSWCAGVGHLSRAVQMPVADCVLDGDWPPLCLADGSPA